MRRKATADARLKAEEEAKRQADEAARLKAAEEARLKADEEEARRQADEAAWLKAAADARLKAEEEAQRQADEAARLKAAEEVRLKAEEEAKWQADEAARLKAAEEVRLKAEEEARRQADEVARLKAAEEARLKAEEEAQRQAEEAARLKAVEQVRLKAEEEEAKRQADEAARLKAAVEVRLKADEEEAKRQADEAARLKAAADVRLNADEEEAKRQADEEARLKAEEGAKRDAKRKANAEALEMVAATLRDAEPTLPDELDVPGIMVELDVQVQQELAAQVATKRHAALKTVPSEAYTIMKSSEQPWREKLLGLDAEELERAFEASKEHPLMEHYVKAQTTELELEDGEWEYGVDDVLEDLLCFQMWSRVVEARIPISPSPTAEATLKAKEQAPREGDAPKVEDKAEEGGRVQGVARPLRRELFGEEENDMWNHGHSQRDYYGSRNEEWWGPDAESHYSWGWARHEAWSHPYWGYSSWRWQGDEQESNAPSRSVAGSEASSQERVREALLHRKSTQELDTESVAEETPTEAPAEEPSRAKTSGWRSDQPDAWKCDKKGTPLCPHALYMRFYREIRSSLDALQLCGKLVKVTSRRKRAHQKSRRRCSRLSRVVPWQWALRD